MGVQVRIREAAVEDLPAVVALWKELMDYHKVLDPIFTRRAGAEEAFGTWARESIEGDEGCVFVAEAGGEVVGYCQVRISKMPPVLEVERYGQIHECMVREDLRGRGIGPRLVGRARQWCRGKGLGRMEVHYSVQNPAAGEFWTKMGFEPYLRTLFMAP